MAPLSIHYMQVSIEAIKGTGCCTQKNISKSLRGILAYVLQWGRQTVLMHHILVTKQPVVNMVKANCGLDEFALGKFITLQEAQMPLVMMKADSFMTLQ